MRRFTKAIFSTLLSLAFICTSTSVCLMDTLPDKTVMVYMVGSNLTDAAYIDIGEMISSAVDPQKVNVLIYTGGAVKWPDYSNIPSDHNMIYKFTGDSFLPVLSDYKRNMGSANTLSFFVKYCMQNERGKDNMLILWDHGGGPMLGYGLDETYNDLLSLNEIDAALDSAGINESNKLSLLGFDACLMGSIETAEILASRTEQLVFSQETEPGFGWNYQFLKGLESTSDKSDYGKTIIDSSFDFYSWLFSNRPDMLSDVTLSSVNVNQLNQVVTDTSALFDKMRDDINSGYVNLAKARQSAKCFGVMSGTNYNLIDFKKFIEDLAPSYPTEASKILTDFNGLVMYSRTNVENSNGLSIYFPEFNQGAIQNAVQKYDKSMPTSEVQLLNSICDKMISNQPGLTRAFSSELLEQGISNNKTEFTYNLTEDQKKVFSKATYNVVKRVTSKGDEASIYDDSYVIVLDNIEAKIDDDGKIIAKMPPSEIHFAKDGDVDPDNDWPLWLKYAGGDDYWVLTMFDTFDDLNDSIVGFSGRHTTYAKWRLKITDDAALYDAIPFDNADDQGLAAKQTLDFTQYDLITFVSFDWTPKFDENGMLLQPVKWKSGGVRGVERQPKYGGIQLYNKPISDYEDYYCTFSITDVYGNTYNTDLIPLK